MMSSRSRQAAFAQQRAGMGIEGLPWRPYRTSNTIIMAAPFPVARFSRLLPEMLAASWSLIPVSSSINTAGFEVRGHVVGPRPAGINQPTGRDIDSE